MYNKKVVGYSDEYKGEILAEYVAGASVFSLTRKYGVGAPTIDKWVAQAGLRRGATLAAETSYEVGSMVTEYIKAQLRSMIAVTDHISNEEWLMQQSAEGIALVLSTMHDKTVYLLSSMQANAEAARLLQDQDLNENGTHLLPSHPDYVDPETLERVHNEQQVTSPGSRDSVGG